MERLTDRRMKGEGFILAGPKEYKAFARGEKPSGKQIYHRLLEIEDILGDDYDLDRLREMLEADRDGRVFIACPYGEEEGPSKNDPVGPEGEPGVQEAKSTPGKWEWIMNRFTRGERNG